MKNKKKEANNNLSFSQDNVLRYRKTRNIIAVERTDWERLVGMLNRYSKISLVWWAIFSFGLSLAIELLISYYSFPSTSPARLIFLTCFAIACTATILTFIFALVQKNSEDVKKKDILDEMERMKNALNEEQNSDEIENTESEEPFQDTIETFTIIKATYGGEKNNVDVTQILTEMIVDGKLVTKATNALTKEDPTPGIKKELVIEYEHNGEKMTRKFDENDEVSLP